MPALLQEFNSRCAQLMRTAEFQKKVLKDYREYDASYKKESDDAILQEAFDNRYVAWMHEFEKLGKFNNDSIEVYRGLSVTKPSAINTRALGRYWTWDKTKATNYSDTNTKLPVTVVVAQIKLDAIDFAETLKKAVWCGYELSESEKEITVKKGAKLKMISPTQQQATASQDDDEIGTGKHALTTDKTGKFWGNAGAGGVFYAKDTSKFLLAFRSKYVNEPHTWGVWGGAIDHDETPLEAIKREIEEETGYKGKYKLIPSFVYKKGDFQYHNYIIEIEKEFKPKLCWETEKSGWFGLDEFPTPLHFGLKALLPHLKEQVASFKEKVTARYLIRASLQDWSGEWVHYSDVNKVGVYPGQFHRDPAGVYLFPKEFKTSGTLWKSKKYKFTVKVKEGARILDLSKLSKTDLENILKKLDIPNTAEEELNADRFWDVLRNYYTNKSNSPGAWNKALRSLGYDAIFDDTDSIHVSEVQLVALTPAVLKIVDVQTQNIKRGQYDRMKTHLDLLAKNLAPYGETKIDLKKKAEWGGKKLLKGSLRLLLPDEKYIDWYVEEDEANHEMRVGADHTNIDHMRDNWGSFRDSVWFAYGNEVEIKKLVDRVMKKATNPSKN